MMRGQVPTEWGWMDAETDEIQRENQPSVACAVASLISLALAASAICWGAWAVAQVVFNTIGGK